MKIKHKKIETKEQLLELTCKLSQESTRSWENASINDYLEALKTWPEDATGYYKNFNLDTNPNFPSWRIVR